jgi:hypothetical protein
MVGVRGVVDAIALATRVANYRTEDLAERFRRQLDRRLRDAFVSGMVVMMAVGVVGNVVF